MRGHKRLFAGLMSAAACLAIAPTAGADVKFMGISAGAVGYDPALAAFKERNRSINLRVENVAGPVYATVLRSQLQAGVGPDVFFVTPGSSEVRSAVTLARAGHLEPLSRNSAWAKRLPAYFLDRLSRTVRVNGKQQKRLYAAPVGVSALVTLYNAGLFRQRKWAPPKTFADLLKLCKTIASSGDGNTRALAYSASSRSLYVSIPANVIATPLLPSNWAAQKSAGKTTFARTRGWRTALQRIVDMKNANCFPPAPQGTTDPQAIASFAQGRTAMVLAPASQYGQVTAINPKLDVRGIPFPTDSVRDAAFTFHMGTNLAINAKANDKKQAHALLNYIAGRPGTLTLINSKIGLLSPYEVARGRVPDFLSGLRPAIRAKRVYVAANNSFPNLDVTNALNDGIQGLFTGQTNVSGILASLDKAWPTR